MIARLQKLHDVHDEARAAPIYINSGYRCPAYQQDLKDRGYETATGVSQHELGKAADITFKALSGPQMEVYAKAFFKAIGVGKYFIHVDLRDDKERRWYYAKF